MSRIKSFVCRFPLAVLMATMVVPAAVHSAVLTEIRTDHVVIEDGERIESPESMSLRATPGEIAFVLIQENIASPDEGDDPSAGAQVSVGSGAWEIEPEAGEEIGDDVCYSYEVMQSATTSVDGDALAVAEVGAGAGSSADAGIDPLFAEANVEEGFSVQVTGQGAVFSHQPISISGNDEDSFARQGRFLTQIGAELSLSHAGANAVAAAYPDTAENEVISVVVISEVSLLDCLVAFTDESVAPGPLAMEGITGTTDTVTVELSNTGETDSQLQVALVSISDGYGIIDGLPITDLEPGDPAVEVNIECTVPQAPGTLVIETSDPAYPTVTYDLICEAVDPAFEGVPDAPGPLVLTGLAGGSASATIEVANAGDAESLLDVGLDSISAGYTLVSGLPIAGLEVTDPDAQIVIECSPPQAAGSLVLASNEPDSDTITYDLECMLETFTVGGMVSGLEGDQVVLQNNGGDDQVVTADGGFAFSPQDDGTDYDVTIATQPNDPSQTCTVTGGTGTLAGENVNDVEVTCRTIMVELDQSGLDFGIVTFNDNEARTIMVTNSGAVDLLISAISTPDAPFFLTGGSCLAVPVTLAPMETCTVDVQFSPTQDGSFTSSFQIDSNADSSPNIVVLNGEGMPILPVPTLGHWALLVLMLSLLLIAGWRLRMNR